VGLDEFAPIARLLTIQISYKPGHALVYKVPADGKISTHVKQQLAYLYNAPHLNTVGANLKYDMRWLWRHASLVIMNHRFDTQLVGGLLNENRFNNLKGHCKEYAPELGGYEEEFEAKWSKADMANALDKDPALFLTYAGGDTDAVLRIYPRLRKELLKDPALTYFYVRLLQPASKVFQKLETRGIVIDVARYEELRLEAEAEKKKLEAECFAIMPQKILNKYFDDLKLTRDVILVDYLFSPMGLNLKPTMLTPKGEAPSTAWDHLKQFQDHPVAGPFVKKLKEYKAVSKTLSTYIIGFLKCLRSDGCFHPSYILAKGGQGGDEDEGGGTLTGRSSCKDPAYQTWPKRTAWAKRLRTVVKCPLGYVIVKMDFSQGELRIMADQSNCKEMINAYLQGLDLHAVTAALFMNMTLEEFLAQDDDVIELGRYRAKAGNFGLIYRISPEGFMAYAEHSYGVKLTLKEAEDYHKKFFQKYPEIHKYHEKQVATAQKLGYVRSSLGRIRHLPLMHSQDSALRGKQERQAINSPTQGCLFDMMMMLMVQIDNHMPDVWMFGNTHDSLEMYLKEDTWQEDVKKIKQLAEHLPLGDYGWNPKVPFVVDFEVSTTNLAACKKYKVAA
jgi:DNA polymerase I-like protein with 3'-5' exonuclease and polymerase domains